MTRPDVTSTTRRAALACAAVVTLALAIAPASTYAQAEQTKLTASDGAPNDQFGADVAVGGGFVAVGAPNATVGGNESQGAVYVFGRPRGPWAQTAKLIASDGTANDRFGSAVTIAGDTLVVGARQLDGPGAAYVFTKTDGTWTETARLTTSDGARIGHSIAMEGDTLVAGSEQGRAYVFERRDGTWMEETTLIPWMELEGGTFDSSVDIAGKWIAVGAFGQSDGPVGVHGRVFMFERDVIGNWWRNEILMSGAADPKGDLFGWDVALNANETVAIGAPGMHGGRGAARVFSFGAGRWSDWLEITVPDGVEGDSFGSSVAFAGTTLMVGAPGAGIDTPGTNQGAAYMFTSFYPPEPTEVVIAEDGTPRARFGRSAAVAGGTIVLGAPRTDVGGQANQGAVYVSDGPFQQYFAEGATGFFHTDLGLFNRSRTTDVLVRLNPTRASETVEVPLTMEARTRQSIDVNQMLGAQATGVWIQVGSDSPVVATRQVRWGPTQTWGSTLETGALGTSDTWYFAEGSTFFSSLFYVIANPNAADATVTIKYLRSRGAPVTEQLVVPAHGRRTIWANAVPGLGVDQVTAVISADLPIVAERTMYAGEELKMGTTSLGAPALSSEWLFAEGETSSADTYLMLANPGDATAEVTVEYGYGEGDFLTKAYQVPAASRRTIFVDDEDPVLAATELTMKVSSSVPIVAERAMWWGPTPATWYAGHVTLGATPTVCLPEHCRAITWVIPEGASGGPDAEETLVLVRNEASYEGSLRVEVVLDDGTELVKGFNIGAFGRLTFNVQEEFPEVEGQRFSVHVEFGGAGPFTVEYARYQGTMGRFRNGGGIALATRVLVL